jgi:hypothetical protein
LAALVEAGGKVDQEDHGDRKQAQGSNQEAEVASLPHQRQQAEDGAGDPGRNQQIRVSRARRARFHRRHPRYLGKPRVARLPDLDRPVVDELRDDKAGAGGDEDNGGGASGGDDFGGGSCQPHQQTAEPADPPLEQGDPAEDEGKQRPQPRPEPGPSPPAVVPRPY